MNSDIKILVVDDDPDILFATSRIVKSAGHEVLEASSAGQCMELVKKYYPELYSSKD